MNMNNKQLERWAPWVLLIAVVALWQAVCTGFSIAEFIFPAPLAIAQAMNEFAGPIAEAAWKTFWVTMVGFGLSIVVGVLLGFLVGSSRLAYAAVYPLLVAFNAVPKAAIVPILIVWFGIGVGPGILTAFLISFFPIMKTKLHNHVVQTRRVILQIIGYTMVLLPLIKKKCQNLWAI